MGKLLISVNPDSMRDIGEVAAGEYVGIMDSTTLRIEMYEGSLIIKNIYIYIFIYICIYIICICMHV